MDLPRFLSRTRTRTSRPALSALGVAALVAGTLLALPAQAATTVTPKAVASPPLQLMNVGTGECLSPAGGGTAVSTTVVQFFCDTDKARRFTLLKIGKNFELRDNKSNKCLSPASDGTAPNATIVQYFCANDPSEAWTLSFQQFTGSYRLVNVRSRLCLAMPTASSPTNAAAVQHACDTDPSRRFILAAQPR